MRLDPAPCPRLDLGAVLGYAATDERAFTLLSQVRGTLLKLLLRKR